MGRKLAALGFRSVRIDVSGIGDSVIWEDEWQNHPYGDQLTDDVRALIQHLKTRADRFCVAGLCSGAFVAYHAAQADPAIGRHSSRAAPHDAQVWKRSAWLPS